MKDAASAQSAKLVYHSFEYIPSLSDISSRV